MTELQKNKLEALRVGSPKQFQMMKDLEERLKLTPAAREILAADPTVALAGLAMLGVPAHVLPCADSAGYACVFRIADQLYVTEERPSEAEAATAALHYAIDAKSALT